MFCIIKHCLFSPQKKNNCQKINSHIDRVLSRYIISQIILSLIIGILTFILMISLRLKMPLVLSVVNGVVNIIPYFGPIIGGVPIVFIAMTSSITKGIIALVGVFIIQQVGRFVSTKDYWGLYKYASSNYHIAFNFRGKDCRGSRYDFMCAYSCNN